MMARLLVIDDDTACVEELVTFLTRHGHETSAATTAREGLQRARAEASQLLIIAQTLPDMTGPELCGRVRVDDKLRSTPVIIVSPRDDEIDRVVGFEVGADDFVVKPYSLRELELRVRAILRRKPRARGLNAATQHGSLEIDPTAHRVTVSGEDVSLSALEFKLLTVLYQRRGRVQSRTSLLESVWTSAHGVSVRTVDACVKRLRRKLGQAGQYVQTVRGVGYRFSGDDL